MARPIRLPTAPSHCEFYGTSLGFFKLFISFPLQAEDANEYFIGLNPHGVIVLKNKLKVANYFW